MKENFRFVKLKAIEAERAKRRQLAAQNNEAAKAVPVSLPGQVKGDARDIAAKKVGMSGRTRKRRNPGRNHSALVV